MKSRLEAVDWLRGLAALWVLSYHANIAIQKAKYFGAPSMGHWAAIGNRGVDLFFILSGFIMAATVPANAVNDYLGARNFAIRRALRIFPAYFAVFVPLMFAALLTGFGSAEQLYFLQNLFLLPRDDLTTYVPVVAWTLTHELMFYLLFTTAYVRRGLALGLLLAWSAGCVFANATGSVPAGWRMQLSLLNIYFLVGVGAACLRPLVRKNVSAAALIASLALLAAVLHDYDRAPKIDLSLRTVFYLVGFGGLIVSAAESGLTNSRVWHLPLKVLGQQSYSLYLVHYPVVIVIAMALKRLGMGWWALLPLSIAVAVFASWVIYVAVERPGQRLGRWLTKRRTMPGLARSQS